MSWIVYGLVIAHINSYRHYYTRIFITFSVSLIMKKLVKSIGSKDNADLVGLGGYAITGSEFVKLLGAIKDASNKAISNEDSKKIIDGLIGNGIDWIKNIGQ